MEHETTTLLGVLVAFGGALVFVVRSLMNRNDKLIETWQASAAEQTAEIRRTVNTLADAVKELKEWRAANAQVTCSMEQVHAEMTRDMAAIATCQREIFEIVERIHREVRELNNKEPRV